jgi:hypothetical protein
MTNAFYVAAAVLAIWWLWRVLRSPRPTFPPLKIADDDPEMTEARLKAQATLGDLRSLHASSNRGVRVKVPFVTSNGVRELLWAEVQRLGESDVEVLYLTPPVTHTGRLDRNQTHPIADVVDWQVELPDQSYRGGFTMRVMFGKARAQWGTLPPQLEAEERRYGTEA